MLPRPIFDNLDYLENPYYQNRFDASPWTPIKEASSDLQHALYFLYSYKGSTATYNSYRREIERLLQWTWCVKSMHIEMLRREHLEEFIEFCMSPPIDWIGTKNVARFKNKQGQRIANKDWRPFVIATTKEHKALGKSPEPKDYQPSQKAIQATFSILSSFFNFLVQEEFIFGNPVALIRQKSRFIQKNQNTDRIRRITNYQWDEVIRVTEKLAEANPEQHERTLFIIKALLGMYLRISELVADERSTPTMGDFQMDQDRNWWFHVLGKGNKTRLVSVSHDMLETLKRYRQFRGLSSLPFPGEQTPLIPKISGRGPVTSTRQIRNVVQLCFDLAHQALVESGQEMEASELKVATVHWLRHTGISEDVKIRPREHVKEDAGHSSMATTDKYIDSEMRERHASAVNKKISREAEDA